MKRNIKQITQIGGVVHGDAKKQNHLWFTLLD